MGANKQITEEKINKIIELSLDSDKSRTDISKEIGMTKSSVWRYQKKYLKGIGF